jgi:hypothetical protein
MQVAEDRARWREIGEAYVQQRTARTPVRKNIVTLFATFLNAITNYKIPIE